MIARRETLSSIVPIFLVVVCVAFLMWAMLGRSPKALAQDDLLAPEAVAFSETFDSVSTPGLPAGWTTSASGGSQTFSSVNTFPDSPPNSIFTNDPFVTGDAEVTSPSITLGNVRHKLSFRQRYQMDYEFDGGVLEISVAGGAFNDILAAGGTFASGGYDTPMVASTLSGRQAWTGDSVSYITTEINLPANTSNQSIRLRWRFASDNMEGGQGWRIDNVLITNTISGFNNASINIPTSGAASTYPSEIPVSGLTGLVTGVQVNLTGFGHSGADDVDIMLVAPNGNKVVLMSDVGGANGVTNLNLIFDDNAVASLPDSTVLTSGTFKPTDFETGDLFPAPAPSGAPTGRLLSAFNGTNPNGNWQLYIVDDNGPGNGGLIGGGWNISIQSSPDVIGLQNTGAASLYPSQKPVAGNLGTVTKAVVTLNNFSHTAPDDVDVMLVAPNGRRVVVMSDVGGTTEVGSLNITLDDSAASQLPDSGTLTSGTFRPTDSETGETFPSPAPQGAPTGSTLAAFNGSAPNGTWRLYAIDDTGNNVGSIAGNWGLTLTTSTTACDFVVSPITQSFPTTGGSGSFSIIMPAGCSWNAASSSSFVSLTSAGAGDGNGTVEFTVLPNFGGPRTGSIDVSNGVVNRVFQIQQPSGCPTTLDQSAVNFGPNGGTGSVAVSAGSACSYLASSNLSWTQITSPAQSGNGTVTFNVQPNPSQIARTATVTVSGRTFAVNQSGSTGKRFDFDGDGKSDLAVYRPSSSVWWLLNSGTPGSYASVPFGISTDKVTPADYDGDRKTDISIYRDGVWYIINSQTNTVRIDNWGISSDTPLPGDFDGDGRADLAIYRSNEGNWYINRSSNASFQVITFGVSTDKPLAGDFDGDGKADPAVYRVSGSAATWAILQSGSGVALTQQFGSAGDIAVPADYDGDGRDNLAVYRPSTGTWYTSTNPAINYGAVRFGSADDQPSAADYDGDGKADVAVFRQGIWYILNTNGGSVRIDSWGINGDLAIPSTYNKQ